MDCNSTCSVANVIGPFPVIPGLCCGGYALLLGFSAILIGYMIMSILND